MNSAKQIDTLVSGWKEQGLSKAEIVVKTAEAELGWCYVWGATGQQCTPANRRTYANRSTCPSGESKLTISKCQVTREDNPKSGCGGCQWYPDGERTLMDDCQGFVKQVCGRVGIKFAGGGCSSMWRDNSNWESKGEISTLPQDRISCVFWQNKSNPKTMDHIGFYIGNNTMIHCSGSVKKENLSKKCTHWAIPRGLDGDIPVPTPTHKTIRKGSKGEEVKLCQEYLMKLGYDLAPYWADGSFGNKTLAAVKAFQAACGLNPDGVVGPLTWDALIRAAEDTPEPAPTTYYTVTIPHLTLEQANSLVKEYAGASKDEEGGDGNG